VGEDDGLGVLGPVELNVELGPVGPSDLPDDPVSRRVRVGIFAFAGCLGGVGTSAPEERGREPTASQRKPQEQEPAREEAGLRVEPGLPSSPTNDELAFFRPPIRAGSPILDRGDFHAHRCLNPVVEGPQKIGPTSDQTQGDQRSQPGPEDLKW
jgi:hypothetical protein